MDVQEKLLQKLDEYGETFLEKHEVKKKKKKKKTVEADTNDSNSVDITLDNNSVEKDSVTDNKKKKKRRRKKKKNETDQNNETVTIKKKSKYKGGVKRHIDQIKRELGLDDYKEEQERKTLEQEIEKDKLSKALKSKHEPEIVVFHSRKKKEKKVEESEDEAEEKPPVVSLPNNNKEIDLETARHDVRKFGISGIKGKEKEEAMRDLLIQLGAKPPKNKYHNYKEFQEMKRREREEEKEQNEWARKVGNKVTKKKQIEKRKRDWNDIGEIDGVMGKFKPGLLLLKKSDVHDLKRVKKTDSQGPKRQKVQKTDSQGPKRQKVQR